MSNPELTGKTKGILTQLQNMDADDRKAILAELVTAEASDDNVTAEDLADYMAKAVGNEFQKVSAKIDERLDKLDPKADAKKEQEESEKLVSRFESEFAGLEVGDMNKRIRAAEQARWNKMDNWQKAGHVAKTALPYALTAGAAFTAGYAAAGGFASGEANSEGLEGLDGSEGVDNIIAMHG